MVTVTPKVLRDWVVNPALNPPDTLILNVSSYSHVSISSSSERTTSIKYSGPHRAAPWPPWPPPVCATMATPWHHVIFVREGIPKYVADQNISRDRLQDGLIHDMRVALVNAN